MLHTLFVRWLSKENIVMSGVHEKLIVPFAAQRSHGNHRRHQVRDCTEEGGGSDSNVGCYVDRWFVFESRRSQTTSNFAQRLEDVGGVVSVLHSKCDTCHRGSQGMICNG